VHFLIPKAVYFFKPAIGQFELKFFCFAVRKKDFKKIKPEKNFLTFFSGFDSITTPLESIFITTLGRGCCQLGLLQKYQTQRRRGERVIFLVPSPKFIVITVKTVRTFVLGLDKKVKPSEEEERE
jgi:hypothetical protein